MVQESFGQRLKRLRNVKTLTQEALGNAAGLRKSHISMLESGERDGGQIAASAALALAHVLDVSVEYLLTGSDRPRKRRTSSIPPVLTKG